MKKTFFAFVLAIAGVWPGPAASDAQKVLAGVFEPEMMTIADNELYIVEGETVLVFSLKGLDLVKKFGRAGEGPGEFKTADYWYNTVTVLGDNIFIDGYDKAVYFSKGGEFLREFKKPIGVSRMVPAGGNFVGVKLDHLEGDVQYQSLRLYDSNGTLLKEIYRQESPVQSMTRKTEMIPDVLNFSVFGDRIYVEKSREGFVIDVLDSRGGQLSRIEIPHEKIPVTKAHEDEALETFKSDPYVKRMGFEKFRSFSRFVWPEALPPIKDFTVADGKIYVRTSKSFDGKETWVILDLQGRPLGRADLPQMDTAPLMANLYGIHYYAIHGQKLYFLRDNEKTDEWELFIVDIQ